ncbi:hypothetical protein ACEQ8H_001336 [Pleosporales sp. CAS-2024a]
MDHSKYSEISPQWTQFTQQYPQLVHLDQVGIEERRRIFTQVESQMAPRRVPDDVAQASLTVRSLTVTARDGYEIGVRTYSPVVITKAAQLPLLVYLHAGGFLFGNLESGDVNCRILCSRLQMVVVNVGYRLAPEWKFPHGLYDSYDVVKWAASNAESYLNASPSAGFLLGGISSGATFAGAISYLARDEGLSPPLTGLWLSIPVCIMPDAYPALPDHLRGQLKSLDENDDNPLLTRKSLGDIQNMYAAPPEDPRMSFLLNTDHARLPSRLYLQVCGRDPLRDEALLWDRLLRNHSGAKSKIDMYQGMPHGFWRFPAMKASRDWTTDLVQGIAFVLRKDTGGEGGCEFQIKGV